jgi:hypothetical protein
VTDVPPLPLSAAAVHSAIVQALETDITIPDGHRGALVTFANLDHLEIALATRLPDVKGATWSVEFVGQHEWTGDGNAVGVRSKLTW